MILSRKLRARVEHELTVAGKLKETLGGVQSGVIKIARNGNLCRFRAFSIIRQFQVLGNAGSELTIPPIIKIKRWSFGEGWGFFDVTISLTGREALMMLVTCGDCSVFGECA